MRNKFPRKSEVRRGEWDYQTRSANDAYYDRKGMKKPLPKLTPPSSLADPLGKGKKEVRLQIPEYGWENGQAPRTADVLPSDPRLPQDPSTLKAASSGPGERLMQGRSTTATEASGSTLFGDPYSVRKRLLGQ